MTTRPKRREFAFMQEESICQDPSVLRREPDFGVIRVNYGFVDLFALPENYHDLYR